MANRVFIVEAIRFLRTIDKEARCPSEKYHALELFDCAVDWTQRLGGTNNLLIPAEDFQTPVQIYCILKSGIKMPVSLLNYLYMFKRWSEYDSKANTQEGMKAACRRRFYTFVSWLMLVKDNILLTEKEDYETIMKEHNKNY